MVSDMGRSGQRGNCERKVSLAVVKNTQKNATEVARSASGRECASLKCEAANRK